MHILQRVILVAILVASFSVLVVGLETAQERRLKWLSLSLPISETSICWAAPAWGAAARVLVGVECMWAPPRPAAEERVVEELDLSGLGVEDSLDLLRARVPDYVVTFDGAIAVFRPNRAGVSSSILDREVPQFTLTGASLVEAADAVNRLFDPSYRSHHVPLTVERIVAKSESDRKTTEEIIARYNRRFEKRLTISLARQTAGKILTAIATEAGVSWRVMYVAPERRYEDCLIEFLTGDEPVKTGPARTPRGKAGGS